jgi:hypothetical protein
MIFSKWLFFNANSAIFQVYYDENKYIFQWKEDNVHFVLD